MNANGESRLLPLSLGRRERGFTIKMSEHPSIHPSSVLPFSISLRNALGSAVSTHQEFRARPGRV